MIKLAADLHIHSCLSPCADMDMTPNNIVNMAYIKGLQAIAVCDHNTARNLPALKKVADACGIIFLPGLEVETKEEVHVLTLFETVENALLFGEWVYENLPDVENMPDFYGEQIACDENDEPIYSEKRMLLQSTALSLEEVAHNCRKLNGVPVPAHINRTSNSLLFNLGFLPDSPKFTALEVYEHLPLKDDVDILKYHILYDSDAHTLENICEPVHFVSAYDKSAKGLLRYLGEEKKYNI